MTDTLPPAVALQGVRKSFGAVEAIRGVDLEIPQGGFVTLLGASGCGKSTLLRMVSGFEHPDQGRVMIAGQDVTGIEPYRRDTAMVFQSYALFPHRTVAQNLAFGLRMRKMDRAQIRTRVGEMLELLGLDGFGNRRVSEMSGGQAQRVALGRALIVRPAVLLLDEPLGALDMKLRRQMQSELKRIHRELGLTFLAVTHDQEEALTLSDKIAVVNAGQVEQFDTPEALYHRPASRFVADFVGSANLVEVGAGPNGVPLADQSDLSALAGRITVPAGGAALALRAEGLEVRADLPADGRPWLRARVEEVLFTGAVHQVQAIRPDGTPITGHAPSLQSAPERGAEITLCFDPEAAWLVQK